MPSIGQKEPRSLCELRQGDRGREISTGAVYLFVNANPEVGYFTKRVWYAFLSERNVERSRNEHRDENMELVTCKLPACKSHGVS